MKFRKILLASATIMMLLTTPSWAKDRNDNNQSETVTKAPEINAKSGTNAIALLIAGLLIAAERRRSLRL